MSGYPIELITNYRAGKISRQQFTKQFSDWQKSRGINYDCKGTADRRGVHVEYRGTTATIRDGVLHFFTGSYIDPKTNCRRYIRSTAKSVFEFCRKIDFARNDGGREMQLKDIPESAVILQVKQVIKATGLKIQRINTGCFTIGEGANRRFIKTADAGTCDFEGYDNIGRFVAIECKRPSGGRLSPAQKERIADINRKGGVAFVAHSGEEALAKLKEKHCI